MYRPGTVVSKSSRCSTPSTTGSARQTPYPRVRVLPRQVPQQRPPRCSGTHHYYEEDVALESDIPDGDEQEHPPGIVAQRREFIMESPSTLSAVTMPRKLVECIQNNELDMLRASMFINRNRFSIEASYKEFVKAAAASTIARYSYDGLDDVDPKSFQTLITVASQLIADITCAKMKLLEKRATNAPQPTFTQNQVGSQFSIKKLCSAMGSPGGTSVYRGSKPFVDSSEVVSALD